MSAAESGGIRFVRVDTFHDGNLDIEFSNGGLYILDINRVLGLPGFEILAEGKRFFYPRKSEDGKTIAWQGGPRPLGADEVLTLIHKQ